jgi:hypothetical protein
MLLQMPAFLILYDVIRGITNVKTTPIYGHQSLSGAATQIGTRTVAEPRYIPHDSAMYHNILVNHGKLVAFGMDFSDKLLSHHSTWYVAIPYLLLVAGAVALQYLQMSRLNARNAGAQVNPQAAMLQKYMPLIFGFIYLNVAAILNVYFIISSSIRILTQEILFRKGMVGGPPPAPTLEEKPGAPTGPSADRTERAIPRSKASAGGPGSGGQKNGTSPNGSNGKPRRTVTAKAPIDARATEKAAPANGSRTGSGAKRPAGLKGTASSGTNRPRPRPSGNGSNGSNGSNGTSATSAGADKSHPRSKAKRERKAR